MRSSLLIAMVSLVVEFERDRMTPLIRMSRESARRGLDTLMSQRSQTSHKIAFAGAMLHAASAQMMALQPNAEGFAQIINLMNEIGARYQPLADTLPSTGEH